MCAEKIDIDYFERVYNSCYEFLKEQNIILFSLTDEFAENLQNIGFLELLQKLAIKREAVIKTEDERAAFMMAYHSHPELRR